MYGCTMYVRTYTCTSTGYMYTHVLTYFYSPTTCTCIQVCIYMYVHVPTASKVTSVIHVCIIQTYPVYISLLL